MPLPGTPVGGERKSTVPGPKPIDSVLEQQSQEAAGVPVTETSLGGQHPGPPLPGTPVGGERKSTIPGPGPIDSVLEQQPEDAAGVPVPETSLRGQRQGPAPGGQTLDHKGLAPRVQPAHGRFGCYGRAALQHFHRVAIGQSCPTVGKKYVPKLPRPSRAKPRRYRAVAKLLAKSGFRCKVCFAVLCSC